MKDEHKTLNYINGTTLRSGRVTLKKNIFVNLIFLLPTCLVYQILLCRTLICPLSIWQLCLKLERLCRTGKSVTYEINIYNTNYQFDRLLRPTRVNKKEKNRFSKKKCVTRPDLSGVLLREPVNVTELQQSKIRSTIFIQVLLILFGVAYNESHLNAAVCNNFIQFLFTVVFLNNMSSDVLRKSNHMNNFGEVSHMDHSRDVVKIKKSIHVNVWLLWLSLIRPILIYRYKIRPILI